MGVLKMSSPLKSRASQKFRANHPYQHQMFSILVKGAKQTKTKFMFQREEDEINNELSNMHQNQQNMLFRPADLTTNQLKKGSPNHKSVSWKESLFEERTIPEEQFFVQEANLVQQTRNKQIWEEKLFPRMRPGKPDLLQQLGCSPSKISVGSNVGHGQDHAQVAHCTESGDIRNLLTNPSNSPLPDLLRQTSHQTASLGRTLPDMLQGTDLVNKQGFQFSQDDLHESSSHGASSHGASSPVAASPGLTSPGASLPEASSPGSSSLESSFPKSLGEFCRTKEQGCLKLSLFLDCDPCIQRQR